jgi:predicted RNA-binding Zn-ribbon protein involved in translation (DUF1610 family)
MGEYIKISKTNDYGYHSEWYCGWYKCPACGVEHINLASHYCMNCGVELIWED